MPRLLVTMPHFAGSEPLAPVGESAGRGVLDSSLASSRERRKRALKDALLWLTVNFDSTFYRLDRGKRGEDNVVGQVITVGTKAGGLDIEILTAGSHHLLTELTLPPTARQIDVDCDPAMLAFACHDRLALRLGNYDWYCYVEDDILLLDPMFFQKLSWFNSNFGDDKLLSPNRFEVFEDTLKVYVDGGNEYQPIPETGFREIPPLVGNYGGREMRFQAPVNPMAGCFFLNARQMDRWARSPGFGSRYAGSFNPVEAAAFLGQRKLFDFYRPAVQNADFLEVQHAAPRLSYGRTPSRLLAKELAGKRGSSR
jgi:hypothetical protein